MFRRSKMYADEELIAADNSKLAFNFFIDPPTVTSGGNELMPPLTRDVAIFKRNGEVAHMNEYHSAYLHMC